MVQTLLKPFYWENESEITTRLALYCTSLSLTKWSLASKITVVISHITLRWHRGKNALTKKWSRRLMKAFFIWRLVKIMYLYQLYNELPRKVLDSTMITPNTILSSFEQECAFITYVMHVLCSNFTSIGHKAKGFNKFGLLLFLRCLGKVDRNRTFPHSGENECPIQWMEERAIIKDWWYRCFQLFPGWIYCHRGSS